MPIVGGFAKGGVGTSPREKRWRTIPPVIVTTNLSSKHGDGKNFLNDAWKLQSASNLLLGFSVRLISPVNYQLEALNLAPHASSEIS